MLLEEHPNIITVIPVLLAVRENNIQVLDEVMKSYNFNHYDPNVDYIEFIRKTGLIDLFYDKRIKNLVDYVTGVEVGLDTNGRSMSYIIWYKDILNKSYIYRIIYTDVYLYIYRKDFTIYIYITIYIYFYICTIKETEFNILLDPKMPETSYNCSNILQFLKSRLI